MFRNGTCINKGAEKKCKYKTTGVTSTKVTVDPEGATCLLTVLYAYGKPRLPPVHKYSSLRSTVHRAAGLTGLAIIAI